MKRKTSLKNFSGVLASSLLFLTASSFFAAETADSETSSFISGETISQSDSTTSTLEQEAPLSSLASSEMENSEKNSTGISSEDEIVASSSEISSISSEEVISSDNFNLRATSDVVVDVSTETMPYTIVAGSTDNYEITGTYTSNTDGIIVQAGYNGTITLNNVNIVTSGATKTYTALKFEGNSSGAVTPIVNDVSILLKGTNTLKSGKEAAGLEVQAGAQITIAADSSDSSASLEAICDDPTFVPPYLFSPGTSGAGIGASQDGFGGNIIIKSGTIKAQGGALSAAVGGGANQIYNGNIIITGGNIQTVADKRTSIIGGGGKNTGNGDPSAAPSYSYTNTILFLPSANLVGAFNKVGDAAVGHIITFNATPGAFIEITTSDVTKNADIFIDLSIEDGLQEALDLANIPSTEVNLKKLLVGNTGTAGTSTVIMNGITDKEYEFYTDVKNSAGNIYTGKIAIPIQLVQLELTASNTPASSSSAPSSSNTPSSSNLPNSSGTAATSAGAQTNSPKTGDRSNISLWTTLFAISTLSLTSLGLVFKKIKNN